MIKYLLVVIGFVILPEAFCQRKMLNTSSKILVQTNATGSLKTAKASSSFSSTRAVARNIKISEEVSNERDLRNKKQANIGLDCVQLMKDIERMNQQVINLDRRYEIVKSKREITENQEVFFTKRKNQIILKLKKYKKIQKESCLSQPN